MLNVSPVLLRRASRNESSKRIAVPFDFHKLFVAEGFEFIDDIHWVNPMALAGLLEGGGGLQLNKPVPVTEYILVYRKKTDRSINWNIRKHPDQEAVKASKVEDGYEATNLWKITPSRSKVHPATFPVELAEKVIKYCSFQNDVVLDPFAGTGTIAIAAINLKRRFVMCELEQKYTDYMGAWLSSKNIVDLLSIEYVNTSKPGNTDRLSQP